MILSASMQRYRFHLLLALLLLAGLYSSVIPGMVRQWYLDGNYSHGFLVPVISAYLLYRRVDELKQAEVSPSGLGMTIIISALALLIFGTYGGEYFTLRASMILLLIGLVLHFFGREVFRIAAVPILFLFFMIPLPYIVYDAIAFPLKLFVTKISVIILKLIGVSVIREGNVLMFSTATFEVADACSGIRSLLSLLAMGTAYACLVRATRLQKLLIILAAIPLAVATNALRVIMTGLLAQHWGKAVAEGFFHEFAGLLLFAVAIALLLGLGALIRRGDP